VGLTILAALIVVAFTTLAAVMAAEDAAAELVSPGRVVRLVEAERSGAAALEQITSQAYRFRAAGAFVTAAACSAAGVAGAWVAWELFGRWGEWLAASLGCLAAVVVVFSFGQALPRTLGVQNPERVGLAFAPTALRLTRVVYPLARILSAPWRWGMRLIVGPAAVQSPWISDGEHRAYLADEQAAREETEEALIEAVADFTDKVVREVMVPRTDMTCLPAEATAREAIEIIEEAGYSRLPVFNETVDDIKGVLYAKDLLAAVVRDAGVVPADIARPAFFVPETKPVQELLIEMQSRTHIAIVADEYGGTAGLVTIEDLLEEIVGEIFDEYDRAVPMMVALDARRFRVDARMPVDDLNERFGTAIEMEADTIGGVVTEVAGRIPDLGDAIEIDGLRLTVDELEGTRIRQLIVESAGTSEKKEEAHA